MYIKPFNQISKLNNCFSPINNEIRLERNTYTSHLNLGTFASTFKSILLVPLKYQIKYEYLLQYWLSVSKICCQSSFKKFLLLQTRAFHRRLAHTQYTGHMITKSHKLF